MLSLERAEKEKMRKSVGALMFGAGVEAPAHVVLVQDAGRWRVSSSGVASAAPSAGWEELNAPPGAKAAIRLQEEKVDLLLHLLHLLREEPDHGAQSLHQSLGCTLAPPASSCRGSSRMSPSSSTHTHTAPSAQGPR